MPEKQYIITIDEAQLTLEFLTELRAHGAEIRAIEPEPQHIEQLDVPPALAKRITRDLEAIAAGESEGRSWEEVKAELDRYLESRREQV